MLYIKKEVKIDNLNEYQIYLNNDTRIQTFEC